MGPLKTGVTTTVRRRLDFPDDCLKPVGMIKKLLITGVLLVPMGAVLANDTMAELPAGGLVFTKTGDVEMRSEDLQISEKSVDVLYHFYNHSMNPVTSLVAFPMPDINQSWGYSPIAIPSQDPENLLGFITTVNGKKVHAWIEQKAMVGEVDRSKLLRDLHIPLAPHLKVTWDAINRLKASQIKKLLAAGLVGDAGTDFGNGQRKEYAPNWRLKSAFYWEQTFPPQKETVIHHHYMPAVGGSSLTSQSVGKGKADHSYDKYGIDSSFVAAFNKRAPSKNGPPWSEYRIRYVLKTGANWAKPIGAFRLVVDKGAQENLVSFRGDRVKKISPTQFEMTKTNFTPTRDIDILILKPVKE